jgi:capsular polysaccharide biosynthesis protein
MFLERMNVREVPASGARKTNSYQSVAPPVFVLNDVIVHSSAGILAVDGFVVTESLEHTNQQSDAYELNNGEIRFFKTDLECLNGVALSILAGGCENYYHWTLESVARLGVVPENYKAAASFLLIPDTAGVMQRELLDLLPLPSGMKIRAVRKGETLRVQTLILPGSVTADYLFHPCIKAMSHAAIKNGQWIDRRFPRRIYIDRRGAWARPLANESELVERLREFGFTAVVLENLSLHEQISLFQTAEIIVAPHGAGLTNLVYAKQGCQIIELFMDSYVNWCFRHLAGVLDLKYDCIIGRTLGPWADLSTNVHGSSWAISVLHVMAAVERSFAF